MKHRIFVSINAPEELKKVAEKYIAPFMKSNLARVAENGNWHITVVFCGYLDDEKLNELKKAAKKIADETKSFELTPEKIIFAPLGHTRGKPPRMVWLAFKHSQEFANLCKKFADFGDSNLMPSPHITLARFQQQHYLNLKPLLPSEGITLKEEAKPFIVKQINIMESYLSKNGQKYELAEKYNLLYYEY